MSRWPKAVVLLSGGIDSTTLATYLLSLDFEVYALTVAYQQRHQREIEAARTIAQSLGIEHRVIQVPLQGIARSALLGDSPIPHTQYNQETQRQTVVPNRNMILLSLAVAWAVSLKAEVVAYAAHRSDYAVYPDCRDVFVRPLRQAIQAGNYSAPTLLAPFLYYTKAQIVALGLKLGAPYHLTWSCYEGDERPCLECGTCRERTEAFALNQVPDPVLTPEEWQQALQIIGWKE